VIFCLSFTRLGGTALLLLSSRRGFGGGGGGGRVRRSSCGFGRPLLGLSSKDVERGGGGIYLSSVCSHSICPCSSSSAVPMLAFLCVNGTVSGVVDKLDFLGGMGIEPGIVPTLDFLIGSGSGSRASPVMDFLGWVGVAGGDIE